MKKLVLLFLVFNSVSYSQYFDGFEYPFIFEKITEADTLILGYHKTGTDSIDDHLGEIPATASGVRCLLPTNPPVRTKKDIQFSCGNIYSIDYRIKPYGSTLITWLKWLDYNNYWGIDRIEIYDYNTGILIREVSHFIPPDSVDLFLDIELLLRVFYSVPLSWPSYYVLHPNGGEVLEGGDTTLIRWGYSLPYPYAENYLYYTTNDGNDWNYIDSTGMLEGEYIWQVPSINSNNVKLRVGDYPCVFARSEATFMIFTGDPPQLNPVEIPITVYNSLGDSIDVLAGMHPDATDGIDQFLGEADTIPPPPGELGSLFFIDYNVYSKINYRKGHHLYFGDRVYYLRSYPAQDSVISYSLELSDGTTLRMVYYRIINNVIEKQDTLLGTGEINFTFPSDSWYTNGTVSNLIFNFDGYVPVELISFDALSMDDVIKLNWVTASELNNIGFEIERKSINEEFRKIGFVPGHGTTTELHSYSFLDSEVSNGKYTYRLKQSDLDGTINYSDEVEVVINIPLYFSLEQNYPNPFNPSTKIAFTIPNSVTLNLSKSEIPVTLKVYDVLGNEVDVLLNEIKPAGKYEVNFDGSDLSSGVYFYQLKAGNYVATKKMILLR